MYTGIDMNEDFSDFNGYLIKVQDLKCVKAPVKVSSVLPSGLKRNEYRITFEYDDYSSFAIQDQDESKINNLYNNIKDKLCK
jgi:hypothetical protein